MKRSPEKQSILKRMKIGFIMFYQYDLNPILLSRSFAVFIGMMIILIFSCISLVMVIRDQNFINTELNKTIIDTQIQLRSCQMELWRK